jgi:hypothetical protein
MVEQLALIGVLMNLEKPRVSLEGIEHPKFLLPRDDDRLRRFSPGPTQKSQPDFGGMATPSHTTKPFSPIPRWPGEQEPEGCACPAG